MHTTWLRFIGFTAEDFGGDDLELAIATRGCGCCQSAVPASKDNLIEFIRQLEEVLEDARFELKKLETK